MRSLISLQASNFLSLGSVNVELQDLTVLVGPNGVGKSNLLRVIQFLGDTARLDLVPAVTEHGGMESLLFRGAESSKRTTTPTRRVVLGIKGLITGNSSENAPDEYQLSFWQQKYSYKDEEVTLVRRRENFVFKRTQGRGRRITVTGSKVEVVSDSLQQQKGKKELLLAETSSALSTLPRLKKDAGNDQISRLAELFTTFRVFEIDVSRARQPSKYVSDKAGKLESDAGNLAAFLRWLSLNHKDVFELLKEDLKVIVPSVSDLVVRQIGGSDDSSFYVFLVEKGLAGHTNLADASFGTVRALALLAMLHDPQPPRLTCVEEIDHGLHPHALDRIVERMRSAARRTQLLVVTHSPALANRLKDAKETLRRDLRSPKARDYEESDSRAIAKFVRSLGLINTKTGTCASFEQFRADLLALPL